MSLNHVKLPLFYLQKWLFHVVQSKNKLWPLNFHKQCLVFFSGNIFHQKIYI